MKNFSDAIIIKSSFKFFVTIQTIEQKIKLIIDDTLSYSGVTSIIEKEITDKTRMLIDCDNIDYVTSININGIEIYPDLFNKTNSIRKISNRIIISIDQPFYYWYHQQKNYGWILYSPTTYF